MGHNTVLPVHCFQMTLLQFHQWCHEPGRKDILVPKSSSAVPKKKTLAPIKTLTFDIVINADLVRAQILPHQPGLTTLTTSSTMFVLIRERLQSAVEFHLSRNVRQHLHSLHAMSVQKLITKVRKALPVPLTKPLICLGTVSNTRYTPSQLTLQPAGAFDDISYVIGLPITDEVSGHTDVAWGDPANPADIKSGRLGQTRLGSGVSKFVYPVCNSLVGS